MPKTLEQILTQRAYVVMNTNASRKVKTLGNVRTMNTVLPRHYTKWHSVQRRATPTVKAGQISKIVKKDKTTQEEICGMYKSTRCSTCQEVQAYCGWKKVTEKEEYSYSVSEGGKCK